MRKIQKLLLLFLIILGSIVVIYDNFYYKTFNYIVLGDSLSMGINPYNQKDYGYNDYVKDYLKKNNQLKTYKEYTKKDMTINDLLQEVNNNLELKKDLRESNIVTLTIGFNDFMDNIDEIKVKEIKYYSKIVDKIIPKLEELIKEIKKYAKNKIIIIGYYNPIPFLFNTNENDIDNLFNYITKRLQELEQKYQINYLNIYNIFKNKNYLDNPDNIHPNKEGYQEIYKKILPIIKN